MGQAELARLLNDMAPDDRTGLLDECPAEVTKQLLAVLSPEERTLPSRCWDTHAARSAG